MQLSENLEVHVLSALLIDDDITTFVRSCLSSDIHVPSSLRFMNEEDSGSDSDSDSSCPETITCSFDLVLDGVMMPKDAPTTTPKDDDQAPHSEQLVRGELPPSPPDNNIGQNTGGALVENTVAQPEYGDGFSSCGGSHDMMLFDQFEIVSDGSAQVEYSYIVVESVVVEDECAEPSKEK